MLGGGQGVGKARHARDGGGAGRFGDGRMGCGVTDGRAMMGQGRDGCSTD